MATEDPIIEPTEAVAKLYENTEEKPRLTVLFSLHHQHACEDPVSADSRSSLRLETTEQPYGRRVTIGPTPTPIDLGWLKGNVGHILIENRRVKRNRNPTQEELEQDAKRVLIVCSGGCGWRVRPGGFFWGEPEDPSDISLYSENGLIEVHLLIVPR